jgi:hypothetical protein
MRLSPLLAIGCALLFSALAAPSARADFMSLEPGKRIKGHQGLDCEKCHDTAKGVARNKCLGCHEHKPLARRINKGLGLHSKKDFKKGCQLCHLEHKGASYNPIDWRPFGGQKRFNHSLTGYDLEGAHKRQDCKKCHEAKYKESGRTKFLGLDDNCLSCHDDVHRFQRSHRELTNCKICHSFDARAVTRAKGLKFDHGKIADFPLNGRHIDTKCSNCHTSTTIFKMKDKPDQCADCHKDPHKNVYTAKGRDCDKCHSDKKTKFLDGKFAHGKLTRFDLKGKHAKQKCKKCHEPKAKEPPKFACSSCHQKDSIHVVGGKNRFARRDCGQCHQSDDFKSKLIFAHGKQTGFNLSGKHASISCKGCHRMKPKKEAKSARETFEFFSSGKCIGCHAHTNSHKGRFNDRPRLCIKCHVPGSANIKTPNHRELSTHFAQQGAHAKISCEKCHGDGLTKLSLDKGECAQCHAKDDEHKGNLGKGCKQCHFEGYPWSDVIFDHNKQSEFKLEGKHQAVPCTRCHTSAPKEYKPLDTSCASCHAKQDVHEGKLGTACGDCHDVTGRSPLFDHDKMTDYPLIGAHKRADCRGCHFDREQAAQDPPVYVNDLTFPTTGQHCADCHGDPHGLRAGARCLGCHDYESFLNAAGSVGAGDTDAPPVDPAGAGAGDAGVPDPDGGDSAMFEEAQHEPEPVSGGVVTVGNALRDKYHDVPPFSLAGGHSRLECHRCHGSRGDLTGFGQLCDTCHRQDDVHAGSLGPKCAECHSQRAFAPSYFSHTSVGYSLVGAHRMLSCKQCHSAGNYMGLSGECVSCHLDDSIRAGKTLGFLHGEIFIQNPCLNCHNQVSWTLTPFIRRRF